MVPASPTSETPTRSRSEIPDSRAVSTCRSAASASTSASNRGRSGSGPSISASWNSACTGSSKPPDAAPRPERIATTVSARPAAATA